MYYTTTHPSPLGVITLACDAAGESLVGLWLQGQKYHGGTTAAALQPGADLPVLASAKRWLDSFFVGERPSPSALPLAPVGTAFQQEVWGILREIPYGSVTSYGEIAKQMAQRMGKTSMSSQAVGGAVGHNPMSIVVPCHRVVGSNGSLTGFAGGVQAKLWLLALEGVDMTGLFIPKKGSAL